MTKLPAVIELDLEDESQRLWAAALNARRAGDEDVVALGECVDLGLHAVEILVLAKLQGVRGDFPATIAARLELPEPGVDPERDSGSLPSTLEFHDVVDLLSDSETECVSPGLHRGWEDRRFSCRRSRATTREAVGFSVSLEERARLLVLAAYRNRLFRYPPPVRVVTAEILEAWPGLSDLVERLMVRGS